MASKKFAISVPEEVMEQVDRAAAREGVTRSRFITNVLRLIARARSDAEITRRVNELFADPEVVQEQTDTSAALLAGTTAQGTEW